MSRKWLAAAFPVCLLALTACNHSPEIPEQPHTTEEKTTTAVQSEETAPTPTTEEPIWTVTVESKENEAVQTENVSAINETAVVTETTAQTASSTPVPDVREEIVPTEPVHEPPQPEPTSAGETETAAPETGTVSETTTTTVTESVPAEGMTVVQDGVMIVDSGTDHPRAIELFGGSFNTGARFAQVLNAYKASFPEEVSVYCMTVPTSQAFYTPPELAGEYGNQAEQFDNIAGNLDGVTGVPVLEALAAHAEEPIYSRTDYHWQPLGAYYAGEEFAAYAGVPYAPLDTYEGVVREGYAGAFARVNGITELDTFPESFTYYKPANLEACTVTYYDTDFTNGRVGRLFHENISISASYTVFVGTDECILEVETGTENDRVLVIFKDSYGNALVPFLTQSFARIYLCDYRYFEPNAAEFVQEVGATDVLFAMCSVTATASAKVDALASHLE